MTEVPLFSRDAFAVRCVGSPGMRNEHAEVTSPSSERERERGRLGSSVREHRVYVLNAVYASIHTF